jgi:23S rRNA-/tRNA-specific pseudouridylate synthase
MGFPVIGDPIYGKGKMSDRLMLHSGRIRLEEEGIDVQSPYPVIWPNLKLK